MQHLEVSGAVRPLKWSLGVKWLNYTVNFVSIKKKKHICTNGCDANTGLCVLSTVN